MRRASVMLRRFQGWTERIGFQEKMWYGCAARWRAGSDCLDVSSCSSVRAFRFLLVSPISQFHNHAQYIQAVCLAGHTSCKHGGLYE